MLKAWWAALLDLVYPARCPVCRKPAAGRGAWCPACVGPVLAQRELNVISRRLTALAACHVLCEYSGGVKQIIRALKFRGDARAAVYLMWLLTEKLDRRRLGVIDIVVPVPLHAERLAERGYNQTELIFRRWAGNQGLSWGQALERTRATTPQWELEPAARRKNIKGAFCTTRPELIQGKTVLLVDDIVTTGATLNECARVLKRSGATKVVGLALASGD